MASRPAVRETALLMPEATPACDCGTELMMVVVSGATLIAMPRPNTTTPGKKPDQYPAPVPGIEKSAKPAAAIVGPAKSGGRGPNFAIKPPDQRESANMISTNGNKAAPAAVGEKPCT